MGDYGYPNYRKPPKNAFSSESLPDVGDDTFVSSGANDFDFPQDSPPPGTESGGPGMTPDAMKAFFSQPRRSGRKGG